MATFSGNSCFSGIVFLCLIVPFADAQITTPANFFYKGTTKLDSTVHSQHRIDIPGQRAFPFYGNRYNSMWLTTGGFISFDQRAVYDSSDLSDPNVVPSADLPMIAPFYHNGEGLDKPGSGSIYYRTLDVSRDLRELQDFGANISNAVVGIQSFLPVGGLIVTWEDVVDGTQLDIGCGKTGQPACLLSTFQAAIVTDQNYLAFAIFNFAKMNIPIRAYYQSGFNAGYGGGWTTAIPQGNLKNANTLKGSDVTGRYYFQISSERIVRGGCRDKSLQAGSVGLVTSPYYGGMYGGEMVEVSGVCLSPGDNIRCSFGNIKPMESTGTYINEMKAKCNVPRLLERGHVRVVMTANARSAYTGSMVIAIPGLVTKRVKSIDIPGSGWNLTNPSTLTLTWDSQLLSNQMNARVTIKLVGYRETGSQAEWVDLAVLGTGPNTLNSGTYTFKPRDHRCKGDLCNVHEGLVEVRLVDPSQASSHLFLVSKGLPLGWFVNNAMVQQYGSQWPHSKCVAWYNQDKQDMSWLYTLPYCPCTLGQALVDIGNFLTDPGCSIYAGSKCNFHRPDAVHCVRSVQPTPAGNQCCYDVSGSLLYAADTNQGSTPDRGHAWGAYPYGRPGRVPSLSHGDKDVLTYFYCCLWSNPSDCHYYMEQRPTRDCKQYQSPGAGDIMTGATCGAGDAHSSGTPDLAFGFCEATVYGLGHVQTLDNCNYRVFGDGDFTLLETVPDAVTIQGRFSRNYHSPNQLPLIQMNHSVILTNIGIQAGQERLEIRLRKNNSQRLLDILVNNTFQYFDDPLTYFQDFAEMTVINTPQTTTRNINSNFTVILKNGIGVQVTAANGLMNALVMIPYSMKGRVRGLLGTWNNRMGDDFTTKTTNISVTMTTNSATFYSQFTYTWQVNNTGDSILPHLVIPSNPSNLVNPPASSSNLMSTCYREQSCEFDYRELQSISLAVATRKSIQWFSEIRTLSLPVRSCGLLNVPQSTKNSYNYSLGSTVTLTGCRSGYLSGSSYSYSCEAMSNTSQSWSPSVSAVCTVTPLDEANVGMIVGIILAIVAVLIIAIIIAVVLRRRTMKHKRGKHSVDKANPISSGEYDSRYTEVRKRDEDDSGRRSKEVDM